MGKFLDQWYNILKMGIVSTKFFISFLMCLALTLVIFPEFVVGYILGTSFDYNNRQVNADPFYLIGSLIGLLLGFLIIHL